MPATGGTRLLDAKDQTIETQSTTDIRLIPATTGLAILLVLVIAFAGNHAPDLTPDKPNAEANVPTLEEEPAPGASGSGAGELGLIFVGLGIILAVAVLKMLTPTQLVRLVGAGVVVTVAFLVLASLFSVEELPTVEPIAQPLEAEDRSRTQGRDGIDAWWLMATAAVTLGVVGFALRRTRSTVAPPEADLVAEALRLTLADVDTIVDDRLAIITAYARLEGLLTDAGLARDRSETSREYVGRVLSEMVSDTRPVEELGRLYEHARYDSTPVSAEHRDRAVAALRAIETRATAEVNG